jgi:hypothetical protein
MAGDNEELEVLWKKVIKLHASVVACILEDQHHTNEDRQFTETKVTAS